MTINNSISKYDLQYFVTGFFLISVFIFTDLIGVIDKEYLYFVPRLISDQPYRIFTSILIHADLNHLLSNLGGIIITRYFLMRLLGKRMQRPPNKFSLQSLLKAI